MATRRERHQLGLSVDKRRARAYLLRVANILKSSRRPVAVAYVRVSSRKQAEEGGSLAAQREAIIREAVLSGFDLTEVYADEGVSGGKGLEARPGLAAAIREVEEGRAEAVIVAHSDRLARDTDLAGYVRVRLKQAGGRVIAIGEAKDDPIRTAVDRMLAELERVRGSQRMKFFHATRKAKGLHAGPAPYGLRTGAGGLLEAVPEEASVVERIVRMRAEGASLRAIAAALSADGVPTRTGARWAAGTILKVLRRPVGR
jgi:DNA invertase Pin-like site-specific DNA recombinase